MPCSHITSITLQAPHPTRAVYREECTQCFDNIDMPEGIDVCLQCYNGGCITNGHANLHHVLRNHPLVLNIRRTRKVVEREEPPAKMSKLAIAAETEADKYDTHTKVKCLACGTSADEDESLKPESNPELAEVIGSILSTTTHSRQEEVKAWEQERSSCEHILVLQQQPSRKIDSQNLANCSKCDLMENLWLCLECGNLGCGRAQFGGVGGNSHGLAHYQETQHGVAVKLGSITPEGTADVYCYDCDDEKVDDDLGHHLAHWGIILAERQKTEKSLTEMQIEQNMRWEFTMSTEDGKLVPRFGPGLTGLKNLGNTCYLASILQCLFDLPSFQERYPLGADLPDALDPAQDLETQLRKVAHGLLSGVYSKPDPDVTVPDGEVTYQKGIAPAMLKALVGRGHAEFSTMRQQDAFELMQHLFKLITRSPHPDGLSDPTKPFKFVMEQRLQCLGCNKVRYSSDEQDNIMIDVPLQQFPTEEGQPPEYKPISLKECLDILTAEETVELTCSACGSKDGYRKQTLFKTFPDILTVNARKMAIVNWVPVKVDVPVIVGDEPFDLDGYRSAGKQESEEALPEEAQSQAPAFVANAEALAQLEAMGFPKSRCERALHATGNSSVDAAMEWLFAHMDDPNIDTPLELSAAPTGGANADPEKLEMLQAMGISFAKGSRALRETGGDMERAVDWVFSHPEVGDEDDGDAGVEATKETVDAGSSALPARFQLQSIVCHKGTSIHAGHYVAFIRKPSESDPNQKVWVLFNDEKVVDAVNVEEMKKFAYVYFFKRV
ncbi:hypothetical protein MKZ38_008440 [Zalerion maritima]|uniref:Ubiquitin carboxyl-terminal hydrolase n=1 Tax=Zalerion maritima TaxID=339359 RepID=A0AAD5RHW0_9PEZI|nr:hypothetical protein MKZ38_008440 [Zalerion maritima]